MKRIGWVLLVLVGAPACAFSSEGGGQGGQTLDDGGDDAPGTTDSGASTGPGPDDDGGPGPTSQPGDSTTMSADDDAGTLQPMTDGSTGEPLPGHAVLEIVGGTQLDLGKFDAATGATVAITVENIGDVTATDLSGSLLPQPFSYAGGTFPGTGGTCGAALDAASTCTINVAITAGWVGIQSGEVTVSYSDGGRSESVDAAFTAAGIGSSPNFLVNGDAEAGEPPATATGWTVDSGNWVADGEYWQEDDPIASFFPGYAEIQDGLTVVLRQDVVLGQMANAVAQGGVSAHFVGYSRANIDGDDPHRFRVELLDAGNQVVSMQDSGLYQGVDWQLYDQTFELPPTVTTVRVRLMCIKSDGLQCNGYFDAMSVRLEYGD